MRKLLLLAALTLFVSSPALAADQAQALPTTNDAAVSAPVQTNDAPACVTTPADAADTTPLLLETPTAEPESCYPPECSSGTCCRNKCWIC